MEEALLYIRIYFISIPFMLIYNFGSAILRSYGDSKRPMYYLYRRTDEFSFRFSKMKIVWIDLKRILMIGIPPCSDIRDADECLYCLLDLYRWSNIYRLYFTYAEAGKKERVKKGRKNTKIGIRLYFLPHLL